jgi:hypothetical protein
LDRRPGALSVCMSPVRTIVWCLALALLAPVGTLAYQKAPARAKVRVTKFDYRAEALKCYGDAAATASKFPDVAAGAMAVARMADTVWRLDKVFARELFEKAFALADYEAGYAGARGTAGGAARLLTIRLYAKRDFDRARALGGQPIEPRDTDAKKIENAKQRAELFADLAERAFATNEPASLELARQSVETGYLEPAIPRILSSFASKYLWTRRDPGVFDLFDKALEAASAGEHASYASLAEMNATLLFHPGNRNNWLRMYKWSSWDAALENYLRRVNRELAAAKAQGRKPTVPPGDIELIARDQPMIDTDLARWSGDPFRSLRNLLKRVAAAAPKPTDVELHDRKLFSDAISLSPPEIRELAEEVFDRHLRDSLLLLAADKTVKLMKELPSEKKPPKEGEERKDPIREYLDAIVDDRLRDAAEDHVLIALATSVARNATEVESLLAKVSALDLRVQAYGVAAMEFVEQKKSDEVVTFAEKARKIAETAPRTVRTVRGLCLAAMARQSAGDKGAVSAVSDLLFVYDRLEDDVEPSLPITPEVVGHLIPLEASPFKVPALDKIPMAEAFAALAHRDPLGTRAVANALETPERRVDALVAAALALAEEGKQRTARNRER